MEEMNVVEPQHYIDFLAANDFNAVRLPLSVPYVLNAGQRTAYKVCGEYSGWLYMDMLVHVAKRLARAGIFLVFDMHTVAAGGAANTPLWCFPTRGHVGCSVGDDGALLRAWRIMARTFCSHPNVIMADIYNEPFGGHWGSQEYGYPDETDWAAAAERIGNEILRICPRWLIM
eukprot:449976-Prymnesium_polylepis.1